MTTRQGAITIGSTAVGAGIGTFIPGVGTAGGAAIGAAIGGGVAFATREDNAADPTSPNSARLSASVIGHVIPYGLGCNGPNGKHHWLSEPVNVFFNTREGGKGLTSGQKVKNRETFISFAMSLGEGPIVAITRIWANNELVFDVTASNTGPSLAAFLTDAVSGVTFPAPTATQPAVVDTVSHGTFSYTLGTYEQLPDPLIQSDQRIAQAIGGSPLPDPADYVSAYRHEVMLYWHNYPISDLGSAPQVTVETITAGQAAYPSVQVDTQPGEYVLQEAIWSPDFSKLYTWGSNNPLKIVDIGLRNFNNGVDIDIGGFVPRGANSRVYGRMYRQLNGRFEAIDADTGGLLWTSDAMGSPTVNNYFLEAPEGPLPSVVLLFAGTAGTAFSIEGFDYLTGKRLWLINYETAGFFTAAANPEDWAVSIGADVYIPVSVSGQAARIVKINPLNGSILATYFPQTTSPASSDPLFTSFNMTYDEQSNSLVLVSVALTGDTIRRFSLDSLSVDVADLTAPATIADSQASLRMRPYLGELYLSLGDAYIRIDVPNWSIIEHVPSITSLWTDLTGATFQPLYSPIDQALLVTGFHFVAVLFPRFGHNAITLQETVEAITDRCNIPAAQVDASAGANVFMAGWMFSSQLSGRQALEAILLANNADLISEDFKLRLKIHGGATDFTVPEDHLGAVASLDFRAEIVDLAETRTAALDQDQVLAFQFISIEREYTADVAEYPREPQVVPSRDVRKIELPIVYQDGTTPQQIAERATIQGWHRGEMPVTIPLPRPYLHRGVGDTFTTVQNGVIYRLLIVDKTIDLGLVVTVQCVREEQFTSVPSSAPPAPGIGAPPQTIAAVTAASFQVLDMPLIRDQDDGSILYTAVDPSKPSTVQIDRSRDGGASYPDTITVHPAGSEMDWGFTDTALPDANWRVQDLTSTVDVTMINGSLASVNDTEWLAGANAFIIGREGRWELVLCRDVQDLGNNKYRLSTFYRGRRGTDVMTGTHQQNDTFIVADLNAFRRAVIELTELGQTRVFTATPMGRVIGAGPTKTLTFTAASLKPYAADQIAGARQADFSWDLTWIGRTRIGGGLVATVLNPSMADLPEVYEIDLLDAPGGNVVNKVTGIAGPAGTISAADIAIAYGNAAQVTTIHGVLYQISTRVGRGWGRPFTLVDNAAQTVVTIPDLHAWYDFSDASTITTSGPDITQVADKSPNGHDLTITTGDPPQTGRTLNGLAVGDFDGILQSISTMSGASGFGGEDTPVTIVAVFQADTMPGSGHEDVVSIHGSGGGPARIELGTHDTSDLRIGLQDNGAVTTAEQLASQTSPTAAKVAAFVRHPTTADLYVNREQQINGASFDVGTMTITHFTLGALLASGGTGRFFPFDGIICEVIVIDAAAPDSDLTFLHDYLHPKWGVTESGSPDI